jgi:hypothetical protein
MSVFKCKFTYKKNVKNSKKSTKNLLVEHKFIDQYFNILDINKFRQANTELSNDASEILNEKVRLFAEEKGGKKALPYEDVFKKIDIVNSKVEISEQEDLIIPEKKKVFEVKQISPNVLQATINSQEDFLEYLNNNKDKIIILESDPEMLQINVPGTGIISDISTDNIMTINTINSSKEELVESFENIDTELRADGTFDVVFINDNYGSQLKNSNPILYTTLNTLLKNNFNFNNTNTDLIEAAENNDAQLEYQLTIDFSETADVLNNLTCK